MIMKEVGNKVSKNLFRQKTTEVIKIKWLTRFLSEPQNYLYIYVNKFHFSEQKYVYFIIGSAILIK